MCDEVVTVSRAVIANWNAGRDGSRLGHGTCRTRPHAPLRRSHRRRRAARDHRARRAARSRDRLRDHLARLRRRLAGDKGVPPRLRHRQRLERAAEPVRRARPDPRNAHHVLRSDADRRAALDRDRALPERARATRGPRPGRHARRDARRRAERRRRALGHLRPCAVQRTARAAVPEQLPRLDPDLRERPGQGRLDGLHRDDRADDDDDPDHVVDLPRALPRRSGRAGGSLDRARRDTLGDGQDRDRPERARRRRGGGNPRSRSSARRGDRRLAGDRQLHSAEALDLRAGRHAREPRRGPVPGRGHEPADLSAHLPGCDPARDHVHLEPAGAAHRQALRVPAGGRRVMDAPAPAISLRAKGRARRSLLVNRLAELAATLAAAVAVGALIVLIWSVAMKGLDALNWDFFTKGPAVFGQAGGGVAPALVGSLLLVGIATAIALPFGVLAAIYVSEFAPRRLAEQVRLWLDVLNGFPSIVIGIFVFALCVKVSVPVVGWGHHQSAFAGGLALAIIMLPLVARATMEVLLLVPNHLREASYALGVSKWQTVRRVVLPTSFGGILTGTTLAIARAAGETAPLLFTCAIAGQIVDWNPTHSVQSLPLTIFQYSESADPAQHQQAWAAALVLIAFVLLTSLASRLLLERSRHHLDTRR